MGTHTLPTFPRRLFSLCAALSPSERPCAGGQFSPEDRPDDLPVEADDLLKQATGDTSAADPDGEATAEAEPEPSEDEIKVLREHFKRQGKTKR